MNSRRPVSVKWLRSRACWLSRLVLCCPSWSVGEWGVCSRSCGGGEQTRQVQCVQRTSQTNADALADSRCAQPTPTRRQACSSHSCPPVWTAGPWSQVSMCESDLEWQLFPGCLHECLWKPSSASVIKKKDLVNDYKEKLSCNNLISGNK